MKLKLLYAFIALFFAANIFAQTHQPFVTLQNVSQNILQKKLQSNRSANCSTDTLYYPAAKESFLGSNQFVGFTITTPNQSGWTGVSQAYAYSSNVYITGIAFYATVLNNASMGAGLDVNVSVYNVNSNQPTTAVASQSTTVTVNFPLSDLYTVNFTNPVYISGADSFAVVVESANTMSSGDTLIVVLNSAQTNTYGEGLSYYHGPSWLPASTFGPNVAYEPLIFPIVSYTLNTNYSVSAPPRCTGSPITFTNTTIPSSAKDKMYSFYKFLNHFNLAASDTTFKWDFGDGSSNTYSTNATHAFANSGVYMVNLTTNTGFVNACIDTYNNNGLPIDSTPVVTISASADTICIGTTLLMQANGTNTYLWLNDNSTNTNLNVIPMTSTTYTVVGSSSFGCTASATHSIIVEPNPVASFTTNTNNLPTVVFTNTSANANAYLWNFGDGSPTANTQNAIHVYTTTGTFTVTLTVANDCGIDTATYVLNVTTLDISNNHINNEIILYPNPTNGIINIKMNYAQTAVIEIYNVLGEKVYSTQINSVSSIINISSYDKGYYYVRVSSNNQTQTKKITLIK